MNDQRTTGDNQQAEPGTEPEEGIRIKAIPDADDTEGHGIRIRAILDADVEDGQGIRQRVDGGEPDDTEAHRLPGLGEGEAAPDDDKPNPDELVRR